MASLKQIRAEVATVLRTKIPDLDVHANVKDFVSVLPAVIVMPWTSEFNVAMGRGTDTWELDLLVLVSTTEIGLRQENLDDYVTGAGPKSIREAIFKANSGSAGTFGNLPATDAHVAQLIEYGARFNVGDVEHLGARLRLIVHTRGTE